jgi:quinol-cytochrome oxidoreductase complex cytochrome b subunit
MTATGSRYPKSVVLSLDAALNLLWLGISVAALLGVGVLDWKRSREIRWRRFFAVFVAAIALFPAVSDSDDFFSFSLLQTSGPHRSAGTAPEDSGEKDTIQLARVLESLDHYQITSYYQFALSLGFVALLLTLSLAVFTRPVFASAGRAPPLA